MPGGVEEELGVFAKAGAVVVHERQGVAKGLEQRVDLQDLALEVDAGAAALAEVHNLLDNVLGRLCLAGARLAAGRGRGARGAKGAKAVEPVRAEAHRRAGRQTAVGPGAPDDAALVLAGVLHGVVGGVGHGEDVRRADGAHALAVQPLRSALVQRQRAEGVAREQNVADVRVLRGVGRSVE